MTIYINARWLLNPPTGVERYAYQITKALQTIGASVVLICPKHGQIHESYDTTGLTIVRYGIGQSHIWEQLILPWFFIGKRNDMLLSLMGLGSILVRRKVMTVHDLSFLHEPSWFSHSYYLYYRHMMPLAIRSSKHIITVSEFSKSEILKYYSWMDENKISIAPCAVDTTKFTPCEQPRKKFILAVSSLDPRKNFRRLFKALQNSDISLQLVGNSGHVFQKLHLSPTPNITLLGRVNEKELINLYHSASAFIFPSLYEGFGIPPLEAMASGCPVIVSDIPVLHEICGDAAIYCNPNDEKDIQNSINQLLGYSAIQLASLIQTGYKNIQRFSWTTAANTINQSILRYCKS